MSESVVTRDAHVSQTQWASESRRQHGILPRQRSRGCWPVDNSFGYSSAVVSWDALRRNDHARDRQVCRSALELWPVPLPGTVPGRLHALLAFACPMRFPQVGLHPREHTHPATCAASKARGVDPCATRDMLEHLPRQQGRLRAS